MKNKRRDFIKLTGAAGLGIATNIFNGFAAPKDHQPKTKFMNTANNRPDEKDVSIIGLYGSWAASLIESKLPSLSFRKNEFDNIDTWRSKARQRVVDRLRMTDIGGMPKVTLK